MAFTPANAELGYFNTTNSASSRQPYIGITSHTGNLFYVFDLGARNQKCSYSLGGSTGFADVVYANDTSNGVNSANGLNWIVSSSSVNTFVKLDGACNLKTQYDVNSLLATTYPIGSLGFSPTYHSIYFIAGSTKNQLVSVNDTKLGGSGSATWVNFQYQFTQTVANSFPPGAVDKIVYSDASNGVVMAIETGSTLFWSYYQNKGQPVTPSGGTTNTCGSTSATPHCVGDVNCDLPQNANLLMCVNILTTTGSLITSGGNNNFNPVTATNNVVTEALGINNTNIKTNGVGYLFLAVAILLFNVLWYVSIHSLGSRGIVVPQPIFVSAMLSFAVIGAFVLAGWTDPLILIIGIVALVAFTSPKIVSMIRGGEIASS